MGDSWPVYLPQHPLHSRKACFTMRGTRRKRITHMRYAVVSYDVDDEPQRKKAKLRGGLDEVIARLIIDHDCSASDVIAWCESAVDEASDEKTAE